MPELSDRIPGEIILASYNNQQRDRLVERYVDATARSVATPLPVAGTVSYLTASGVFSIFDGATWVDFIDVRGGQTIAGTLSLNAVNFPTSPAQINLAAVPQVVVSSDTWSHRDDWNLLDTARIINDPDNVPSTRAQFRFGIGGSGVIQSQLYAHANGLMALDADQVAVSLPNTTSLDNRIVRPSITVPLASPVSTDHYELMRFTGSSERWKVIKDTPMTKAHGHHPVHLLNVEFKRWEYAPGYLVAGDPRATGDWLAPTAETMQAAYPWAVDPDETGEPADLNTKVLVEGLLWLVQDLNQRLEALET